MHMSGDDFIKGIADADQRLFEVFRPEAIRVEQGTMGATRSALLDNIASHLLTLLTRNQVPAKIS